MKFFIPDLKDESKTEEVYAMVKKAASAAVGGWHVTDRRIFSLDYRHEGKDYYAEVGRVHGRAGEMVMMILEAGTVYLIVTPRRGILGALPIMVGKDEARKVIDFDGSGPLESPPGSPR